MDELVDKLMDGLMKRVVVMGDDGGWWQETGC